MEMHPYKLVASLLRDAQLEPLAFDGQTRTIFRVLYEPAFGDWVSYQLVSRVEPRTGEVRDYAVTRRVWRQPGVEPQGIPFAGRGPAFEFAAAPIEQRVVTPLVGRLRAATIPAWPRSDLVGLDGWTTTLILGDAMNAGHVTWWCEGPPEWAAVTAPAREFLDHVDKLERWEALGDDCIHGNVSATVVWDTRGPEPADYTLLRDAVPPLRERTPAEVLTMIRARELPLGRVKWASAAALRRRLEPRGLTVRIGP
jgi:hypothetical protein